MIYGGWLLEDGGYSSVLSSKRTVSALNVMIGAVFNLGCTVGRQSLSDEEGKDKMTPAKDGKVGKEMGDGR